MGRVNISPGQSYPLFRINKRAKEKVRFRDSGNLGVSWRGEIGGRKLVGKWDKVAKSEKRRLGAKASSRNLESFDRVWKRSG